MYESRNYVDVGGLISDGADSTENWRQAGIYISRILKAENRGQSGDDNTVISSCYSLAA
jgi:ABC-type uncharacterized transport system substrate-binding protein